MGDEALKISLLTIGDSQVGKSSLLLRFSSENGKFNPQSMPTIGIDFKMKSLEIDGTRIKLQIVSNFEKHFSFFCYEHLRFLFFIKYNLIKCEVGYSWPGKISNHHKFLLSESSRNTACI